METGHLSAPQGRNPDVWLFFALAIGAPLIAAAIGTWHRKREENANEHIVYREGGYDPYIK